MTPVIIKTTVEDKNTTNNNNNSGKRSLDEAPFERPKKILNTEYVRMGPDSYYDKSSLSSSIDIHERREPSIKRNESIENDESTHEEEQGNRSVFNNDEGNEIDDISNDIPSCSNQQYKTDQPLQLENAQCLVQLVNEYSNENGYQGETCHTHYSNNKLWFAAKDLGRILEYSDKSNPIKNHVKNENEIKWSSLIVDNNIIPENYDPDAFFIDFQGARDLILKSSKRKARKFLDWSIEKNLQNQKHSHSTSTQSRLLPVNNNGNFTEINRFGLIHGLIKDNQESREKDQQVIKGLQECVKVQQQFMNVQQQRMDDQQQLINAQHQQFMNDQQQRMNDQQQLINDQQQQLIKDQREERLQITNAFILAINQNNQQQQPQQQPQQQQQQQHQHQHQQQPQQQQQQQQQQQRKIPQKRLREGSSRQAINILIKEHTRESRNEYTYNYKFIQRQIKILARGVDKFKEDNPEYDVIFQQNYILHDEKVFDTVKNHLSKHNIKFEKDNRHKQLQTSADLIEFLNVHGIIL